MGLTKAEDRLHGVYDTKFNPADFKMGATGLRQFYDLENISEAVRKVIIETIKRDEEFIKLYGKDLEYKNNAVGRSRYADFFAKNRDRIILKNAQQLQTYKDLQAQIAFRYQANMILQQNFLKMQLVSAKHL